MKINLKINVYSVLLLAVVVGWICDSALLITGMVEPTVVGHVWSNTMFVVTAGLILFEKNKDNHEEEK